MATVGKVMKNAFLSTNSYICHASFLLVVFTTGCGESGPVSSTVPGLVGARSGLSVTDCSR